MIDATTKWADYIAARQPEWTTIDGVDVLRVPGSKYAAAPATNRRNAAHWIVFNVDTREESCQLTRRDVRSWLVRTGYAELTG